MFFYYYDTFVSDKKYEAELIKAENRLIELGINGRIEKASVLRNYKEIIEQAIKQKAHTIVAVGDDNTFTKVINLTADKEVVIGFIPMVKNSKFAKILGIPNTLEACNILSKRLTKKFNLGKANQNYFIASISIPTTTDLKIECDQKFKISFSRPNRQLFIYNLGNFLIEKDENKWQIYKQKNKLNIIIKPPSLKTIPALLTKKNTESASIFTAKKIKINTSGRSVPVVLDQQTTLKTPVTVTFKPKKIALIVGRNRLI